MELHGWVIFLCVNCTCMIGNIQYTLYLSPPTEKSRGLGTSTSTWTVCIRFISVAGCKTFHLFTGPYKIARLTNSYKYKSVLYTFNANELNIWIDVGYNMVAQRNSSPTKIYWDVLYMYMY